ncbi:glycoside hydrolase family 10 protein [Pedobacter sp. BAL39]|uniref:glycoside hydrolase family 10 protein n=1 Tax=Pedobacter sp. BAL39 TaxID=391596 RepID=UPI0012FB0992|nr:family 10 glycosylhydrolase [Pedobacter sp. BAL39]
MKSSVKILKNRLLALCCCSLFLFYSCGTKKAAVDTTVVKPMRPQVMKEFRAAWIASVANINWPSKPGLPVATQQKEAIAMLDFLKKNNFNAVIFQVRPQADALYKSTLEPWSYFLTGTAGKAPDPVYDPLNFWIEAAHDRGMELHIWINPYRAHHSSAKAVSKVSLVSKKPELMVKLKDGQWWMDPSKKGTQDHVSAVVKDLVKRYDIDGVHFDDYFYPYESYNGGEDFPDQESWARYQKSGGQLPKKDWRRDNVNTFVERIYKEVKAQKKYVKFGISPFGIWRPGFPASIEGMDQYDQLYADAKLWLNKGWIDYFAPQLYWKINDLPHSFPLLLGWWASENTMNRHLWPGMNVGLGGDDQNTDEIVNQVMISRAMLPQSAGTIHWSIDGLLKSEKLTKGLLDGPYKKQALVPASPWLNELLPAAPIVETTNQQGQVRISWTHPNEKEVFRWVVYYQYGKTWNYTILNRKDRFLLKSSLAELLPGQKAGTARAGLNRVAVTAIDRTGNESVYKEIVF